VGVDPSYLRRRLRWTHADRRPPSRIQAPGPKSTPSQSVRTGTNEAGIPGLGAAKGATRGGVPGRQTVDLPRHAFGRIWTDRRVRKGWGTETGRVRVSNGDPVRFKMHRRTRSLSDPWTGTQSGTVPGPPPYTFPVDGRLRPGLKSIRSRFRLARDRGSGIQVRQIGFDCSVRFPQSKGGFRTLRECEGVLSSAGIHPW
jgi:hypothetical protein